MIWLTERGFKMILVSVKAKDNPEKVYQKEVKNAQEAEEWIDEMTCEIGLLFWRMQKSN